MRVVKLTNFLVSRRRGIGQLPPLTDQPAICLAGAVTTVNDEVGTGGVGGGVRAEVDVGSLELLGLTVTTHGDHGVPELLGVLVDEVRETGVNVSRGDGVDTGEVAPLVGEGAGHVDAASLGDVVRGLLLREVGNVARHGGGDDERTGLALLEVVADGLGAVCNTHEIGLDDLLEGGDLAVEDTGVGGLAGVGDKGVNLAKVGNDILDELLARLVVGNVELVGLGLDAVLLLESGGVLLTTLLTASVGDGNVTAHLGDTASGLNTHTTGTRGTGDDGDLALHGEQVHKLLALGDRDRHIDVMWGVVGRKRED
jgi:hypothetical protein